jgi:GAF domain-containing protein
MSQIPAAPRCPVKDQLRDIQSEVLEAIASGGSLPSVMSLLCQRIEAVSPGVVCSVLTVDREGRLHPLAAPSLPAHYSQALEGLSIGPLTGSCGSAAYFGVPVTVTDIENDPRWAAYKALALPLGVKACWSSPIKQGNGRVVGTFAFYFRSVRGPGEVERLAASISLHLCTLAIAHEEAQTEIQQLAYFDPVTGLANRAGFQKRAAEIAALPAASRTSVAFHCIDLDEHLTRWQPDRPAWRR